MASRISIFAAARIRIREGLSRCSGGHFGRPTGKSPAHAIDNGADRNDTLIKAGPARVYERNLRIARKPASPPIADMRADSKPLLPRAHIRTFRIVGTRAWAPTAEGVRWHPGPFLAE